eukprot:Nitzschia sp. Nitz4//scaffold55_size114948//52534//54993//NITZ4_003899-RA/size114948-processed-gene-0.42-mRNA-1//1//CDS//3329554524//3637//frame0
MKTSKFSNLQRILVQRVSGGASVTGSLTSVERLVSVPTQHGTHQSRADVKFLHGVRFFASSDNSESDEKKNQLYKDIDGEDDEEFEDLAYANFDDDDDSHWDDRKTSKPRTEKEESGPDDKQRIYFNPKTPLEDRVDLFVNKKLGQLHPLDIVLTSIEMMRECGKKNTFEGMKFAHDIMDRILEEKHFLNQQNEENPEKMSYTIVVPERAFEVLMYGWANLCRKVSFAPQRMREVLDLMIQEAEYDEAIRHQLMRQGIEPPVESVSGKKHSDVSPEAMFANMSCQPTVGIYNTMLQGLGQASYRSIQAAIEAEDLLKSMGRISKRRGWHTKPNTKSFMLAIQAYARTKHVTAGERAEGVLRRMIKYNEQELAAYAEETGTEYDLTNPANNVRRVVTPDTIAYTAVIQAYGESQSGQAAHRALELLTELLESSNPCLAHDAHIFAATINVFAQRASEAKNPADRQEAAECAENVLWLMLETVGETHDGQNGNRYVVPFNACLKAWAQSEAPNAAQHAEELLKRILDPNDTSTSQIQPDVVSINTCMQAWTRAARDDPDAPTRAEELLNLLDGLEFLEPDVTSYTTVMNAYAKSNRDDKVSQTLRLLESLLSNVNDMKNQRLSCLPFTIVLNAVAHDSRSPVGSSDPLLEESDDAFGVSNADEFMESEDPYSIAWKTYDMVATDLYELDVTPDHLTFATMLNVVEKYTSRDSIERRQRIERILQDACAVGEVSAKVVQALARASPSEEMLTSLLQLPSWPIETVNALPREWIYRVPAHARRLKLGGGGNKRRRIFRRKPKGGADGNPNSKRGGKKGNKYLS